MSVTARALDGAALLQASGERIEALLSSSAAGGTMARERAEELVRTVVELYGAGLERLLDTLDDLDRLDEPVLTALADDPLISGLLLVHGLHPDDVQTRVARALHSVRPYLASHGGDVELVEITDDGVVRLRLMGSCHGCASSASTPELAVDGAVRNAAPEVTGIEVLAPAAMAASVIPVASLLVRTADRPRGPAGWLMLPDADQLAEGRAEPRLLGELAVVICRIGNELFAFGDQCPSCGAPIGGAALQRRAGAAIGAAVLRCPHCALHFDVRAAGRCIDDATQSLQPLPLLIREGIVEIAVPGRVPA